MATAETRLRFRLIALIVAAGAVPLIAFVLPRLPAQRSLGKPYSAAIHFPDSPIAFQKQPLGDPPSGPPRTTNVQVIDFDDDGFADVIACDATGDRVVWFRQSPRGVWTEKTLADNIHDPAHATVVDLDQDGDRDVIVSVLGNIFPDDTHVGSLLWLENVDGKFVRHVLLDDVRRVADAQVGDLDGDGDLDIAVAVFGYARGQILWLENRGDGQFRDHELFYAPGTIHVPLADYDNDGDLDIAAIISQDEEELWAFENLGNGQFNPRMIKFYHNYDLGSAGLVQSDLDGDGDADLILPTGDNLEFTHTYPQPYHGCTWFENVGNWKFIPHQIAQFGGAYAAAVGDLDADGDKDVVLVSMHNQRNQPDYDSVVWLENDGKQNFTTWKIDNKPTNLVTVACGDLNGDGRDDIVAGGLQIWGPFDLVGQTTIWLSVDKIRVDNDKKARNEDAP